MSTADGHAPSDEDIPATFASDYAVGEVWPVGADQPIVRLIEPVTGAGLFTTNMDPNTVGTDAEGTSYPTGYDVGFGAPIRRYLQVGLYNGDFGAGPPEPGAPIGDENPLPGWNWTAPASGSILAYWIEDTTVGSGGYVQFIATSPTSGDEGYIEQFAPVVSSADQQYHYFPRAYYARSDVATWTADISGVTAGQYTDSAGATTGASDDGTLTMEVMPGTATAYTVGSGYIPTDANRIRVRVGIKATANVSGTYGVDVAHASLMIGVPELFLVDYTAPTTYEAGRIYQRGGVLYLQSDEPTLLTGPRLGIDGPNAYAYVQSARLGVGDITPTAQLEVESLADRVTIVGRGASGQTANILTLEQNGGTDVLTVEADGQVGIGAVPDDSNAILTLSKGINFPDTAVASTDVNTLDDYEENTWTPALTWATAGDQSWAYSTQSAIYTKVGRLVTCSGRITTSTSTHTTSSGALRMSGLPFTATAAVQGAVACVFRGHNATCQGMGINAVSSQTYCQFPYANGTAALANLLATDHTSGNVIDIIFQFSFVTAS